MKLEKHNEFVTLYTINRINRYRYSRYVISMKHRSIAALGTFTYTMQLITSSELSHNFPSVPLWQQAYNTALRAPLK